MLWKYYYSVSIISAVGLIVLLSLMTTSIQTSYSPSLSDQIKAASTNDANSGRVLTVDSPAHTLTIVTASNNGTFLPGASYSITPNPIMGSGKYIIKDDGPADINRLTPGVITISVIQQGKYIVTQVNAPDGYSIDKLSKIVQLGTNQNFATATFTSDAHVNQSNKTNSVSRNSHDITYNSKFECGSIVGDKGPLRPGHYDTDISIFNRQDYPIEILWNSIVNDGKTTNQTIKTMLPQTSIGITCKDIRQDLSIGNNSKELVEGFVVIRADPNAGVLGSLSSNDSRTRIEGRPTMHQINLLDVQVFYTANALESLPHELVNSNIVFSILNNTTSKIPASLLMKPLHISLPSQLNQISDPEIQVKGILSQKYNLSAQEVAGLRVKIIDVTVGVAAMIDDHAISTTILTPRSST